MLWTETRIVRQRVNRDLANNSIFTQKAIASILSKDAGKEFRKDIKALMEN